MNAGEALLQQSAKLLMSRERELLVLRRKQHRFEAWLEVARGVALMADGELDRHRILRGVADALKSRLSFQHVAFFVAAGPSLVPVRFDPDAETVSGSLDELSVASVFAEKDGQGVGDDATGRSALGFHRFLWHWVDAIDPSLLLAAGYDRERAEFYPRFDDADSAQFAMVGRELGLLLLGGTALEERRAGIRRVEGSTVDRPAVPAIRPLLTVRELEVSRLLARGKTNKEIGALLGISPRTVQTHVANIFEKVGVRSRAGAATWLVENQLGL